MLVIGGPEDKGYPLSAQLLQIGILEYFSFSSMEVNYYVFITSHYFPSLMPCMQAYLKRVFANSLNWRISRKTRYPLSAQSFHIGIIEYFSFSSIGVKQMSSLPLTTFLRWRRTCKLNRRMCLLILKPEDFPTCKLNGEKRFYSIPINMFSLKYNCNKSFQYEHTQSSNKMV